MKNGKTRSEEVNPLAGRFQIDPEFQAVLRQLDPNERQGLESSLLDHGCLDTLKVWADHKILLDGHHRAEICEKHDIPYTVEELEFESRDEALLYIYSTQKRRNLTVDQAAMVAARELEIRTRIAKSERAKAGGEAGGRGRPKADSLPDTPSGELSKDRSRETLPAVAKDYGIPERKVREAAKVAKQDPELADQVAAGDVTLREARNRRRAADEREAMLASIDAFRAKKQQAAHGFPAIGNLLSGTLTYVQPYLKECHWHGKLTESDASEAIRFGEELIQATRELLDQIKRLGVKS